MSGNGVVTVSYRALYRVWRPQTFDDVVGQKPIVQTLKNAVLNQSYTHAYLFAGPRGTGKTSTAKIMAKAVNCLEAPVENPCNRCAACQGISQGSVVDVIEIDAASNNGVDEIRELRDKVRYAPTEVRLKVYIIDEVHMLSQGAFNALLKTWRSRRTTCSSFWLPRSRIKCHSPLSPAVSGLISNGSRSMRCWVAYN